MTRRLAILLLAGLASGCSVIFMKPVRPDLPDRGASECTDNPLFPVLDGLAGTAAALEGFRVHENGGTDTVTGLWLSAGVITLVSAAAGAVAVSRCHDAQAEQAEQPQLIRPTHRPRPPPRPAASPPPPPADAPAPRGD